MSSKYAAAEKLAQSLLWLQRRVSDVVNRWLLRVPGRIMKMGLIGFIVLSVAISVAVTVDAWRDDVPLLKLQPIRVPPHLLITDTLLNGGDDDSKLQQMMERYQRVMDSLRLTDSLKLK